MQENNKRFFVLLGLVIGMWLVGWMVSSHQQKKSNEWKKKSAALKEQINVLMKEINSSPDEETVVQENRKLQDSLQKMAHLLDIREQTPTSQSILEFRSECEEKVRNLRKQANKSGIPFEDGTLGFSNFSSDKITARHWVQLDLAYSLSSYFLEMADRENVRAIFKIEHPQMEMEEPTGNVFLREFPIQITWEGSLSFFTKFLYSISVQPEGAKVSNFQGLSVTEASILKEGKENSSSNTLKFRLRVTAFKIDLAGEPTPPFSSRPKPGTTSVPIWERY